MSTASLRVVGHECHTSLQIKKFYISTDGTHTLDKNGSLYDPAGTESWNMQIRYETMKLTICSTVQTKFCRYTELIRLCFQHKWIASLGAVSTVLCTPCIKFNLELERERTKEEKEREEVLHLFRCYTHTHTRRYPNIMGIEWSYGWNIRANQATMGFCLADCLICCREKTETKSRCFCSFRMGNWC